MGADNPFVLHFWGVRGTLPMPGEATLTYGGNTSCVEVRCGEHVLVLDAGSGLKAMGDRHAAQTMDILLSHTHIDHVLGLPFFTPAYDAKHHIRLWAGNLKPESDLRSVISHLMAPPLFPLTPDNFRAQIEYHDFTAGDEVRHDSWNKAGIRITTMPLPHPDRATGYRIEYGGKSLCYITDYEHVPGTIDPALVAFVKEADCLIYDSTYDDEEFEHFKGWGHSTWQQAARLADAAKVKTLVLFHHDPDATDSKLNKRAAALEKMRPGSVMAHDGLEMGLHLPQHAQLSLPKRSSSDAAAIKLVERLASIGASLSSVENQDELLELILLEAKDIAGADGGTLYYLTDENRLEFSIIRNDTLGIAYGGSAGTKAPMQPLYIIDPKTKSPNLSTQAVFAVLMKKPINIPDVYSADGFDFEGAKAFDKQHNYRTHSVITVPMVSHKSEAMGCLQLVNAKDPATGNVIPFSEQSVRLVQSLASQAAITLENKKLIDAQKNLLESFIKMIAKAIDAKSPYTGAHCERVPTLTSMLAAAACDATEGFFTDFNLSDEEKYELHIAGWMHDCGKVTTPVHIMDKTTKLETISDRIELVETRFELLKRDARIAMLEQIAAGGDRAALEKALQEQVQQIETDMGFLRKINIGGEFMADNDMANLQRIATQYRWEKGGETTDALSENELYNLSVRKGTLTTEEREIMNGHMVHTCQMLEALPFPKHLRRVPEYAGGHHERMDGKGYPKAIHAGTMSLPARMMAVADVFEALTAGDRPYKPAKKLSETMQIIGQMKKFNHLDPVIVDFFVTSKVYLDYARKYLSTELIDAVDEAALLAIKPVPF